MSEERTVVAEAFLAGVEACFNGEPRSVPEFFKTCCHNDHSWLAGYDAARPHRLSVTLGKDHA